MLLSIVVFRRMDLFRHRILNFHLPHPIKASYGAGDFGGNLLGLFGLKVVEFDLQIKLRTHHVLKLTPREAIDGKFRGIGNGHHGHDAGLHGIGHYQVGRGRH